MQLFKTKILACGEPLSICIAILSLSLVGHCVTIPAPSKSVSTNNLGEQPYPALQILTAGGFPLNQAIAPDAPQAMGVHPEIARIAAQAAKKVAKTDVHRILTTPLSGCLGAPQICAELDAALHADLEKSIQDVQFIQRDEAMKHLAAHGFMSVDAYAGALDVVASDAGAEVVVGEEFQKGREGCHLRTTIADAKHLYVLANYSTGIACSVVPTKTILTLLKDPVTGTSMIVPKPESPDEPRGSTPIRFPTCVSCPDPHYSAYARQERIQGSVRMMITVAEQGSVENAKAVGAVEEGLERVSLEAVSGWKLTPAIGPDGKPFRCRVQVEVTFRLLGLP